MPEYDPKTAPRDKWTLVYDTAQRNPTWPCLNGRQAIELIDENRELKEMIAGLIHA